MTGDDTDEPHEVSTDERAVPERGCEQPPAARPTEWPEGVCMQSEDLG